MSRASCPRQWMVEAARAGQLSAADAAQLQEHLQTGCAVCRGETRFLDWLGASLRGRRGADDEVALRRLKHATLQQAYDRSHRAPLGRLLGAASSLVAALGVVAAGWYWFGRTPLIVVSPLTPASAFEQHRELDREVVVLGDGDYELTVHRTWLDRAVSVRVPEGEIEDLGTVFSVRIEHGKTMRVGVTRGVVALHLRGIPALRLPAGSVWTATPAAAPPVAPPMIVSEPARPPAELSGSAEPPARAAKPAHRADARRSARPSTVQLRRDASVAGDSEISSEDATYLRVLDLLHQSRTADARRLGESYLERFPNGFRRPEIERLVRPRVDSQ